MTLLLKLMLAHLLGDFFLQPDKWIRLKEAKKWRSPFLFLHALIHGVLIMVLAARVSFLVPALIIAVSHLVIDGIKLQFQQETTRRVWFFADQLLHILVIAVVFFVATGQRVDLSQIVDVNMLVVTLGALFVLNPASVIVKMIISKWVPGASNESLQHAGQFIGFLERLLIFTFILLAEWQGVGFLLAAKSIFRFGDLKESGDRKMTEYILIGTLSSFSLAIFTGLLAQHYLHPH